MQSPQKNPERARAGLVPAWHTNFRNYAVLPDTKIVRTSFFVNGLLVLLAAGLILLFVWQEYKAADIRDQSAKWQEQIDKNRTASDQAVALYKKFQAEEQKINELNSFVKGQKIVFSDFIIQLGQTKPQGIVFVSVDYKDTGAVIKGYAQGTSSQATGAASMYEKQLKEDTKISSCFKSISMVNVTRDVQAGRLLFEIVLASGPANNK
jgi:methionine salvage enolase-phosphatase E1